ncbi:MAG: DUF488 domain-containing protein [Gammaproteobacteria bacterium]
MTEAVTIYTIGHSNRALAALVSMLTESGVETLVDVRAHPGSRRHPQFSRENLEGATRGAAIQYHWAGRQLGGMRKPLIDSPHRALPDALRGYADYMTSDTFARAAAQLIDLAAKAPLAVLCAERLPEHCHRSLISDYVSVRGARVVHLVELGARREHELNANARATRGEIIYDGNTQGALEL